MVPEMDTSLEQLRDQVLALDRKSRLELMRALDGDMSVRQRLYVDEYTTYGDHRRAMGAAHMTNGPRPRQSPAVLAAVETRLLEREENSDLKAAWVRDYLLSVLKLKPTDYFVAGEDGELRVDPELFASWPDEVKMLVESVETRYSGGKRYTSVKFVSKSAALKLAVQLTSRTTMTAAMNGINWDDIAGVMAGPGDPEDVVEGAVAALPRPVQAG